MLLFLVVSDSGNSNYQLILNPTSMSWIGAATWCQMKGGEIVTIDSHAVFSMIDWYKDNDWSSQWYLYNNDYIIYDFKIISSQTEAIFSNEF